VTIRLYRDDPYLLDFEASIVSRGEREGRPVVVLDRTAFYPEGGGQPWDTGTLDDVAVLAVVEDAGQVLHVVERSIESARVRGRVDSERRRDHLQQHHGQHLLSRALVETAAARTISFHMGSETSTVDLDRPVSRDAFVAAEKRANEVVWQARPVSTRVVSVNEAEALGVEPPPDALDGVRLVEAEGFDLQACGGTHPRTTSDVGLVLVLDHERYKGGSRVHFVCGHRALRLLEAQQGVLRDMRQLFSCPWQGLVAAAEGALAQIAESRRRVQALVQRAVNAEAERFLATVAPAPVASAIYEDWRPEELRALAERLVAAREGVVLLGSRSGGAHLCFAQSPGLAHDVPGLLREVASRLGGRGGGKGSIAQGGSENAEGLEDAIAWAASRLSQEPTAS